MLSSLIQEARSSLITVAGEVVAALPGVMIALVILCLTRYAAQTVRSLVDQVSHRFIKNRSLRALALQISYVSAWIAGIITACVTAFPDLGLGDIIALLGLGSVAVGFAFQDIVKNFLAGILLLLQHPFRLGDQILVNEYEGTVQSISLRCTEIKTYQGEQVLIPNSVVFTSPVHVFTAEDCKRTDVEIGVDYNTPLPQAVEVLRDALQNVSEVRQEPEPEVDIVGFGDSSINLVVRYWTAPFQADVRRAKTKAMVALKQACDRADISIPYPIRSVYLYDQQSFDEASAVPQKAQQFEVRGRNGQSNNGQSNNGQVDDRQVNGQAHANNGYAMDAHGGQSQN